MKLALLIFGLLATPREPTVNCSEAPRHWQCWDAEKRCESTPARNWKPCRKTVAKCFREAERCYGSWSW